AVRLGGNGAETRIVIDLDRSASGKVSASGSDGRVVLTLAGVDVEGTLQGGGRGVVRNYILDQSGGGARLRVDLNQDAVIKRRFLLPPADGVEHYRYVIDLAAAEAKPAKARLTSRPLASRSPPLNLKKVVVIDAGHGGKDPGARGA